MKLLFEIIRRYKFCRDADRIGPDLAFTHWKLHFQSQMTMLCKKKFKSFGEGSEVRPGVYADVCSKIDIGSDVILRPGTFLVTVHRKSTSAAG